MTLDNHTCYAQTLNAVRIDCALCKPFCISNLLCLGIEHLNKVAAYNLALLLRVGNAFKVFEELLTCINSDNVESESLICLHNLLEFVLAQHSVVNEDTCKVLSDGTVKQCSTNRRVDAAAQTENYAVVAQLLLKLAHRRVNERSGAPLLLASANVNNEVLQQELAL